MTDGELAYGLANCILGSDVRYEISNSYASNLILRGMLSYNYIRSSDSFGGIEEALSEPVESVTEKLE